MPEELLTTKEVAKYLGIHEKQVYVLVKAGRIPATRLTGKWVFPRRLLDEWIDEDARAGLREARRRGNHIEGAVLAAGSNDPVLDVLQSFVRRANPGLYLFSSSIGSTAGLDALRRGYTDVAWSHLLDPSSGEYNLPFVKANLSDIQPVVVNLFWRDIGLVTAAGNPLGIRGFRDLAREDVVFVNRQEGAGTRVLLDTRLAEAGIPPGAVRGYDREAVTHYEVGLAVLSGEADVGLATGAISGLFHLDFTPVTRERFDLVTDKATFFGQGIQAILDTVRSDDFRRRVTRLGSYDFHDSGRIMLSTT